MEKQPDDPGFYSILVAIETDATHFYGANASRPALLNTTDSEQLLAHIAADLNSLLPEISKCSLITAGALFDQTQILKPSYPVFRALEAVSTHDNADNFKPSLVSIGASNGKMPSGDLQPFPDIPLGLLQLLPVIVHGPPERVKELGQAMEYRFMEEGQVSAHSAAWLETAFGLSVNHARLMTLMDLSAMLRLQLDHFGFLPLWELLDAALSERADPLLVKTQSGQEFEWKNGTVHTSYETFDSWASGSTGKQVVASNQALAATYGDWTREVRQYLTTLTAHGLDFNIRLARDNRPLEGTFFMEPSEAVPGASDSTITEHSYSELGTIAVTTCDGARIENYYPLCPQGLNDIHAHLREHAPGVHTVAFPGTILYDEKSRRLVPDSSRTPGPH
jgi:hypothetical protein